jgi:DnaK suppressor protein
MDAYQTQRRHLEARLAQLVDRLHKVERNRRRETNPLAADWQEQAITRQNDEVLDSLEAEGQQEVAAIRAALRRLDDGTYGICVTCDEPIAPARLAALPYALQCIKCATKAERKDV